MSTDPPDREPLRYFRRVRVTPASTATQPAPEAFLELIRFPPSQSRERTASLSFFLHSARLATPCRSHLQRARHERNSLPEAAGHIGTRCAPIRSLDAHTLLNGAEASRWRRYAPESAPKIAASGQCVTFVDPIHTQRYCRPRHWGVESVPSAHVAKICGEKPFEMMDLGQKPPGFCV